MRLKKTYSSREVAALTGLSARQLQLWHQGGLMSPAHAWWARYWIVLGQIALVSLTVNWSAAFTSSQADDRRDTPDNFLKRVALA